ncbi:aspartyl-phosphate phosphatase Spo0E family protein [Siminovitchia sediminis]|uniref:Aspartyl-phosphate phosphatase Spo0E family protein n=1 Tax=Siminovitchia sediminis TaxID=1274353 RepID=A0ABW4KD14_9BACI
MYSCQDQRLFLAKIQKKREEMMVLGEKYGLCADQTVTCSRELDKLLNDYYYNFQSETSPTSFHQMRKPPFALFANAYSSRKIQTS